MTIRQFISSPTIANGIGPAITWVGTHGQHAPESGTSCARPVGTRAGVVTGIITQNVDLLHTKAGSRNVIDLHGTYARVRCLDCGHTLSRAGACRGELEALNPGFSGERRTGGQHRRRPDADAVVTNTAAFRIADCAECGGMLKPTSSTSAKVSPKTLWRRHLHWSNNRALLVAGSSLTVFSGYRFVRQAAALQKPVAIINRGPTRGDDLAQVKIDNGCSPMLALLAGQLDGRRSSAWTTGLRSSAGSSDVERPIMANNSTLSYSTTPRARNSVSGPTNSTTSPTEPPRQPGDSGRQQRTALIDDRPHRPGIKIQGSGRFGRVPHPESAGRHPLQAGREDRPHGGVAERTAASAAAARSTGTPASAASMADDSFDTIPPVPRWLPRPPPHHRDRRGRRPLR